MDINKFDPYVGFDPTQEQGGACGACGDFYWDLATQSWYKRTPKPKTQAQPNSECEAQLARVKADLEQTKADLAEKARQAEEKQARITELEQQLANQPTVCEVLRANTKPIHNIDGTKVVYYVVNTDCEGLDVNVVGLNGAPVHDASSTG